MSSEIKLSLIQEKMEEYIENLNQLNAILLEEYDALKSRDISLLDECLKNKEKSVSFLESFERENAELLKSAKNIPDNSGIVFFKKRINNLIEACNKQNLVNGAVIDVSHQFNQRMLSVILGKGSSNKLYDPNGKSGSDLSKNSVARI